MNYVEWFERQPVSSVTLYNTVPFPSSAPDAKDQEIARLKAELAHVAPLHKRTIEALAVEEDENDKLRSALASLQSKYDLAASALEVANERIAELEGFAPKPWVPVRIARLEPGTPDGPGPMFASAALSRALHLDAPLNAYRRKD